MPTRSAAVTTHDDLRAAVAARSELGVGYEDALTDSLAERFDAHVQHRLRQRRASVIHDTVTVVIALTSIGLGVVFALVAQPLGPFGGTLATIIAWIAIVAINVVHARSRRW